MTSEAASGETLRDLRRAARERRWTRELAQQLADLPADDRERARARYVEEGFEGTMDELRSTPAEELLAPAAGLELAYRALAGLTARRSLRDAMVVLDDPALGRQVLRVGRRPLAGDDEAVVDAAPGLHADPPLDPDDVEADLVVAVVRSAVRAAVLDEPPIEPLDALELELRAVPGVRSLGVDAEEPGLVVLQVVAEADAPPDLARRATRIAAAHLPGPAAVEIVRRGFATAPRPSGVPIEVVEPTAPAPAFAPRVELLAVRSVPEQGELEVHLRLGVTRTVGRAPLARGLVGATEAALDALRGAREGIPFAPAWARTIETLPDRRFLVAVCLVDPESRAARYGLAPGANPIEAATKAALDALNRTLAAPEQ